MSKYFPTIGLEIHAELKTKTKMFCSSKNDSCEKIPNTNICPICMGHPGTLPVINKEAVRQVLRVGVALKGKLADYAEFDRKNYFYPDIPKGYQISQYKHPLVSGGELLGVQITRVHLEEDTAKSLHNSQFPIPNLQSSHNDSMNNENSLKIAKSVIENSLLDFNRAGVPLMELVTEPVIKDAETASRFAKELQLLLWYLDVSEANMERGEMRIEANVSVSSGQDKFGTKVEVKNLNSFKAVEKAIAYEIDRQASLLERGEGVVQETRGWDENKEKTFSQRSKEESHDYRYFPDPDLPKLKINEIEDFNKEFLLNSLPELPWDRRDRYIKEYDLTTEASEVYTRDLVKGQYIDKVIELISDKKLVKSSSNYINAVSGVTNVNPKDFVKIIRMIEEGRLSATGAKEMLKRIQTEKEDPEQLAVKLGLIQKNNIEEIKNIAKIVVEENEKAVSEYRSGKISSIQFLVGEAMKKSRGSANPKILKELLEKILIG